MFETKQIALPSTVSYPKSRIQFRQAVICIIAAITVLSQVYLVTQFCSTNYLSSYHSDSAANSTLGFGEIYAVSRRGSPRRRSLISAASLTGLDITIPTQPIWTEQDITRIRAPENSSVDRGSALAWLGHLNVLEQFLQTSHGTALIMEDDVDWDVRLRTQQIPQTAYAIRELLSSHDGGYYGGSKAWDIIWLGHCGDYFDASRGSGIPKIKSYKDSSMPKFGELHPWTRDFLREIGANQNHLRLVHESVQPLCTFAYAITRDAAEKVLNELAVREPRRGPDNPCKAYDVRLLEGCRDEGLRCITVNPELFHHSALGSEIAQLSEGQLNANPASKQLIDSPTTNIRCSARSRKWKDIQDSITDPSIDAEVMVRGLAQESPDCHIDDL